MRKLLLLIIFTLILLPLGTPALADTSVDVIVTATGVVVLGPQNFAIAYISDDEVELTWVKPGGLTPNWWNTDWDYRRTLTIDNSGQAEDLVGFPMLVHLDSDNFDFSKAQGSGQDVRFIDSVPDGGTELKYEIEKWTDSEAWIWVRVPQVDGSSDTDYICMYYGNDAVGDGQDAENVWNSNFKAVYHMADGVDNAHIYDSTGNGNDGTKKGANEPNEVDGQIGKAQAFDGDNDYVDLNSQTILGATTKLTISVRVKRDSSTSYDYIYMAGDGWDTHLNIGSTPTNGKIGFSLRNTAGSRVYIDSSNPVTTGCWAHIVATWDGTTMKIFLDGAQDENTGSLSGTVDESSAPKFIGKDSLGYGSTYFGGLIDEARFSNIPRTTDWIKATYLSGTDSFIDHGDEVGRESGAANTMIRVKQGSYPVDRTDGYLVYYGDGESFTDTSVRLASVEFPCYRAWSETADGKWGAYPTEEEANFMSASFLFIGFILLATILTFFAYKIRMMLFTLAAAMAWLGLGIWLLLSDSTNLQMSDLWTQVLGLVFVVMPIAVLMLQTRTDVRHEASARTKAGLTETMGWVENVKREKKGPPTTMERQAAYKEKLKRR